jgi:hypothetical protein
VLPARLHRAHRRPASPTCPARVSLPRTPLPPYPAYAPPNPHLAPTHSPAQVNVVLKLCNRFTHSRRKLVNELNPTHKWEHKDFPLRKLLQNAMVDSAEFGAFREFIMGPAIQGAVVKTTFDAVTKLLMEYSDSLLVGVCCGFVCCGPQVVGWVCAGCGLWVVGCSLCFSHGAACRGLLSTPSVCAPMYTHRTRTWSALC